VSDNQPPPVAVFVPVVGSFERTEDDVLRLHAVATNPAADTAAEIMLVFHPDWVPAFEAALHDGTVGIVDEHMESFVGKDLLDVLVENGVLVITNPTEDDTVSDTPTDKEEAS
jgi:hypothetical protein